MYDEYLNHHNISFFCHKAQRNKRESLVVKSFIDWLVHSVVQSFIHSFIRFFKNKHCQNAAVKHIYAIEIQTKNC